MEFNLYGFPDDAVPVSCLCGEYGGAVELNTVFLVDAVLSYGRLVRIFQTDVAFMFFQSGVDGAASLPNVDFAALTGDLVNAWCPKFEAVFNVAEEVG
jgi:hypothetical protein